MKKLKQKCFGFFIQLDFILIEFMRDGWKMYDIMYCVSIGGGVFHNLREYIMEINFNPSGIVCPNSSVSTDQNTYCFSRKKSCVLDSVLV